ncbi:MAG: hypothetical protein M3270_11165 [Thermoproteota archaeon]|nr:hypothetical protein [Thermoproteota archaeon]
MNDCESGSSLLQLPPQKRLTVMKALTALSKYLGCYEQWKNRMKQYNLKWTTGSESIQALQRFFDTNLTLESMLSKVKEMMRVLPPDMAAIIRFACITGLRPSEACESVRLIIKREKYLGQYYNQEQQTLEHFRFPDIFLRPTKKAFISYLSTNNFQRIQNLCSCTLPNMEFYPFSLQTQKHQHGDASGHVFE